jgi:hypothetical protein
MMWNFPLDRRRHAELQENIGRATHDRSARA